MRYGHWLTPSPHYLEQKSRPETKLSPRSGRKTHLKKGSKRGLKRGKKSTTKLPELCKRPLLMSMDVWCARFVENISWKRGKDILMFFAFDSALVYADKIPLTNLRLPDLSLVYLKPTKLISILHSAPCAASSPLWSKVSKRMNRLQTSPPHLSIRYWVYRLIPIQMTLKRHKTSSSGLKVMLSELRARRRNGVKW